MQWWVLVLQEGRDKQFLVKQIEALSEQLQIPEHSAGAQDWIFFTIPVITLNMKQHDDASERAVFTVCIYV